MGINVKYYIISIASIFISLGIGIFIGFNMNGQEIYLNQQKILVDSLENRFSEFKKEKEVLEQNIQNLRIEKEKQNIFIENIFYEIIHDKLFKLNIAIIETTDNYFYEDIEEVLILSGAVVPIRIKYMDKIYDIKEENLYEINEIIGFKLEKKEDFINLINKEVVNFLLFKELTDPLKYIIEQGYLQFNFNYNTIDDFYIDNIVIAGGSSENKKNKIVQVDLNLIQELSNNDFNVVGVERLDVEKSYIPQLKKLNVSTVDNIDNKIGKISLVYILRGATGHFGEKSSAESLAPFVITNSRGE